VLDMIAESLPNFMELRGVQWVMRPLAARPFELDEDSSRIVFRFLNQAFGNRAISVN
jgi:hypothetical protein